MSVETEQTGDPTANPEPELTLREELSRNLSDIKEAQEDATPAAVEPKAAVEPAKPAAVEPVKTTPEGAPATPAATTEAAKPKAPQAWSATDRAHWEKVPAEVQAVIARREEEAHRTITAMGQDAAFGKRLNEVVAPYLPIIRAEGGGTPEAAVKGLLQTAYVLRTGTPTQRADMFRYLANQYQVDLGQMTTEQPQVDPALREVREQLAMVTSHLTNQQQQQQSQVQATLTSQIEAFSADPKNEFFAQVRPVMATLLSGGVAGDLQQAYDMACNADPSVRSTIQSRATTEAEAKRAADAKAAADKKRRAGVSISGSPGASVPATTAASNLSLRDEIRAQLRAANS